MINKKVMNGIKEFVKEDGSVILMHIPTEEEKEYLKEFNIKTEKVVCRSIGLISDYYYETEKYRYYIEK